VPANFLVKHDMAFSGKDLILGFGGLFLIAKSTLEINHEMEGDDDEEGGAAKAVAVTFTSTIIQIILLDIIFSFDSILTAVGIVPPDQVIIMIIAVIVSIIVMMFFSGSISNFIKDHPSMEVLALGFLILIGFTLLLEGLHQEIPKGYIYFAVAFSLLIEFTNIRVKKKRKKKPVKLNKGYNDDELSKAVESLEK
jgi:predicted tellurium resistance membrane protein TerC